MKYFVLTNRVKSYDYTDLTFYSKTDVQKHSLIKFTSTIENWDNSLSYAVVNKDVAPADYMVCGFNVIISRKLYDIFCKYSPKDMIQFLPIRLYFDGEILNDYGILHFCYDIEAVDDEKSVIDDSDEDFPEIEHLVLDSSKVSNNPFFLCYHDETSTHL
ncbi:MAG: hypothetical protein Q4C98_10330, partial [Capnocytophaga sp.]|nr:hypothetical protein [Capnocytophaga sp.]